MSEWNELCLPQYIKMFDPTNKVEAEVEDDKDDTEETNDGRENDDSEEAAEAADEIHTDEDDAIASTKFEKDKMKYGQ